MLQVFIHILLYNKVVKVKVNQKNKFDLKDKDKIIII